MSKSEMFESDSERPVAPPPANSALIGAFDIPARELVELIKDQPAKDQAAYVETDTMRMNDDLPVAGCDTKKYVYEWHPYVFDNGKSNSDGIRRLQNGVQVPGVKYRIASPSNHPDIPREWRHVQGFITHVRLRNMVLLFAPREVVQGFLGKQKEMMHAGLRQSEADAEKMRQLGPGKFAAAVGRRPTLVTEGRQKAMAVE